MHVENIEVGNSLSLSLFHHFIVNQNYNTILIHGVKDEVWLENINRPYKIIRIVQHRIFNNYQFKADNKKVSNIVSKLKRKTLSFNIDVLNILINCDEDVNIEKPEKQNQIYIKVKNANDILSNDLLKKCFEIDKCNMKDTLTEKGIKDVISKELNEHYKVQNEKFQNTFKLKTSIFAFLFSLISFLVFQLLPNINIDQLVISKNNINIFKIISSIFYHNNIFVLLILVITLIYLSEIIESVYKRYKVTLIIFISIIISSLMTMTLTPNIPFYSLTPIVCSFISAYIFFGMHYKIYFVNTLKMFLLPSIIAIITIVLLDNNLFILAIGGLLGGFLGAMIGDINYEEKIKNRLNGIFLTILLVGFLLFLLYIY